MKGESIKCGPCGARALLALTCSKCRKDICAECVLEAELRAGMCWMCLDWTAEGQTKKAAAKARGKRDRQTQPDTSRLEAPEIVALYCDGGVVGKNPSEVGGTWAWCGVDASGRRVIERGGFVPARPGRPVTNNHTEQIAITLALEAMPAGWTGTVYSDSNVALGRVFKGWATNNLPRNISERSAAALRRLGKVETVLLQGHPTKADLERGVGAKRGYPVSEHNVWCDEECGRQARSVASSRAA